MMGESYRDREEYKKRALQEEYRTRHKSMNTNNCSNTGSVASYDTWPRNEVGLCYSLQTHGGQRLWEEV